MELKLGLVDGLVWKPYLLIVPYGIEMKASFEQSDPVNSFNRTLWN